MRVERFEKEAWKKFAESAHLICFKENRPLGLDRIDFALLAITDSNTPAGYVTCRETDRDSAYWQFGGAFPSIKGTALSYRAYESFLGWMMSRYLRVYTLIKNDNKPMLRMAASVNFKIVGIKLFHEEVLLEHLIEREDFSNGKKP